jgi:putative membrane protein
MSDLNDPRVFFAAERTALAWNRTALTLLAFGFAVERFGLFMKMMVEKQMEPERGAAFWFGLVFILLGCFFSFTAAAQYKSTVAALRPVEIPARHNTNLAFALNIAIGVMAAVLAAYLFLTNVADITP